MENQNNQKINENKSYIRQVNNIKYKTGKSGLPINNLLYLEYATNYVLATSSNPQVGLNYLIGSLLFTGYRAQQMNKLQTQQEANKYISNLFDKTTVNGVNYLETIWSGSASAFDSETSDLNEDIWDIYADFSTDVRELNNGIRG